MKKFLIIFALALVGTAAFGQPRPQVKFPEYQFTTVKENPITSVKNQNSSGTCWAFSTIGFFESEAIRLGKITDPAKYPDFSEFFVVSHSYYERALKYVRLDGKLAFGAGSEADDVLDVIRDHGIVPNAEMTGMNYGTELPVQGEMDAVLKGIVDAVVRNPNRGLTTAWARAFQAVLDEYLGKRPEKFVVDGKEYTPLTYRDALKINPSDYVTLTSFSHHPFYTKFVIEVEDNWRWDAAYNVPIDEFMSVLDNAINNGYTVAWGADVSHPGFTRDGLAIFVDPKAAAAAGSDQVRWVGGADGAPAPVAVVEKEASQEQRQKEFDNKTLTDDHGMQIYGIAKDQDGKKYYMVKNSWGVTGKYDGIWYATEAFVKGQSLDYMIHKDALPKDLKAKLGIK
ncbi:MAG: aminopeptidase [Bacteroidales bacterium]|nr:aminopeptidase [Bacteroidales bacterium]MBO4566508.1 aminopeptidase [Bacteroidales bacterium]